MNFLNRIFAGRNGSDQLNLTLLVAGCVLLILGRITDLGLFIMLYYAAFLLVLFRMFSRNIPKRQAENRLFLEKTSGIRQKLNFGGTRTAKPSPQRVKKDRANFRYLKCPNCKQPLRVPRGKGNIKIKCSKCGLEFMKKV